MMNNTPKNNPRNGKKSASTPKHPSHRGTIFDNTDTRHDPVKGEKAMWVAVITQAMMDALSRSNKSEDSYQRHEAIQWLTGGSKDFRTVCQLAGFDPDYIRKKAKQCLAAPRPWRAIAGTGKRYEERKAYRKRIKELKHLPATPLVFATASALRLSGELMIA